jgi:hypothetical protein
MAKMTEDELGALCEDWITNAKHFDESDLEETRQKANDFYDGKVDIEPQPNRSKVVSSDVADVMGWILPGLLRVFTASDRAVIYEPNSPEEEDMAKEATFGINHIFLNECGGFRLMKDAMFNGLLHGNGPIKLSWHGEKQYKIEDITGLTMEEVMALLQDPDVEDIIELNAYQVGPDGQPMKPIDEEAGENNAADDFTQDSILTSGTRRNAY